MKHRLAPFVIAVAALCAQGAEGRERLSLDPDWRFSPGHTDPAKDFGCGTEYFNYLTKANSIHNAGPYAPAFSDSAWVRVDLPHDFVVDLPYDSLASHSHGYKQVGYRYPSTSVGWYRRRFTAGPSGEGRKHWLVLDGVFRDQRVWVNGFYLGGEPSGYAQTRYDITPYLKYGEGEENVLTVRSDATLEEGWFYEGGGIYRHTWLETAPLIHIVPGSVRVTYHPSDVASGRGAAIEVTGRVANHSHSLRDQGITVAVDLLDTEGRPAGGGVSSSAISIPSELAPRQEYAWRVVLRPDSVALWEPGNPALYDVRVSLKGTPADSETIRTGFRTVTMAPDTGLAINGKPFKIYGVNQHQDHPGVGAGIPDAVNVYRLKELMKYGVNTIRTSHNPATPEMLAACDSLGLIVVEENRLLGINGYHTGQLEKMIDRDFNHPSIILWSVGNEEWGVEWDQRGAAIVADLRDITHRLDPTRLMTVATSGGPRPVETPDVAGYNYIMQNPVERHRTQYPGRIAFGSEETTGCGTRGVYFDDTAAGHIASMNRTPDVERDSTLNRIARGWKFYRDRPWLMGLCYWTGFDYRGEPNPMVYPATGSQFGLLDYCGFPKDEAYYLKAQWTDEPVLHILPHWNLEGHEGETVPVWVYTNLDEVELTVNGRNLGRQKVDRGGYASFDATYAPGKVTARGYRDGKRILTEAIETSGPAAKVKAEVAHRQDGISIVNVTLLDAKGRFAPTASPGLRISLPADVTLLGAGNGDPAIRVPERPAPGTRPGSFTFPAFNGHAQFIISSPTSEIPKITIL